MREITYYRRQAWGQTIYRISETDSTLVEALDGIGRKAHGPSITCSQWEAFTRLCFILQGGLPTLTEVPDPKLEVLR